MFPRGWTLLTSDLVSLYSHEVHISGFGVKCLNILMMACHEKWCIHSCTSQDESKQLWRRQRGELYLKDETLLKTRYKTVPVDRKSQSRWNCSLELLNCCPLHLKKKLMWLSRPCLQEVVLLAAGISALSEQIHWINSSRWTCACAHQAPLCSSLRDCHNKAGSCKVDLYILGLQLEELGI